MEDIRQKKAYIFDLDGTLLNTLTDLTIATNEGIKVNGYNERTEEEVRGFIGNGNLLMLRRAMNNKSTPQEEEKALKRFREFYKIHCSDNTKKYDGIDELLKAIKDEGKKIGIASNKGDFAVQELAEKYFFSQADASCGENEEKGIRRKPNKDILEEVLRRMNCKIEDAVYVGDSEVDIQTAKNAGIPCISVSWGYKGHKFLEDNGAEIIVDTPNEIIEKYL